MKKCTLDDLLLLATGTPERALLDDIALHFYSGLRSLTQLQASIECPVQQIWACAEGLRLLFDANAIWIRDTSEHPPYKPPDSVREAASLTSAEKDALRDYLSRQKPIETAQSSQCGEATWARLPAGKTLGHVVAGLSNSNLQKTQSVLWISVDVSDDATWEAALLLPGDSNESPRDAEKMCTWLLSDPSGNRCSAMLAGLRRLTLPFGQSAVRHDKFWRPDREKISDALRKLNVSEFQERYRKSFLAMHGVLRVLHDKFTRLIAETLKREKNSATIIFSYRVPEEDCIRFLPTDIQAEEFVQSKEDIGEFLDFCSFPYPLDKALSGWVLSTGMCDYTEGFAEDGRWSDWLAEDENGDIARQLKRVKKFLQRKSTLPHVYLVPILMAPRRQDDGFGLRAILMVSISVAAPLPVAARREIFDLAVQMRPALDIALDAQKNSETLTGETPSKPPMPILQKVSIIVGVMGTLTAIAAFSINYLRPIIVPPIPVVTLGVNPIPMSALTILAHQENYYGRYNLQVKEVNFPTGRKALDALLSGDAQFATVAETPLVLAALANQKLVVVATMAESPQEMQLIVNSDRIHTLRNLIGATVATAQGTNADYFMSAFLQKHGIRPSQVTVKGLSPSEMVNAFANGSISGYFVWQPFIYKGMQLTKLHPATYSGSDFYTMTFNIVTSPQFAAQHLDEVEHFLMALKDAENEIAHVPAEGQQAVANETHIDRDALVAMWGNYDFHLRLDDSLVRAMEDQRQWAMKSGGYPPGTTNFRDLLAPEALKEIDPKAVDLH